jgi:3-phosphoshikimate 1-carboxyvinyltransferase
MTSPSTYPVPTAKLTKQFSARVPGSKSITNRALFAATLCQEPVLLVGALESEDTQVASDALRSFGVTIEHRKEGWWVDGRRSGPQGPGHSIYLANAGTAVRFLSSILVAKGWPCRVHGTERMHQRPIGPLLKGLIELGGNITSELSNQCPPLQIKDGGLEGGETAISGQVSSQFFSGLMMAAPLAKKASRVSVTDAWLSLPYIHLTASLLESFGVKVSINETGYIDIPGQQIYQSPGRYEIEPDATAATYPMGLAMLHRIPLKFEGLNRSALQGDIAFVEVLEAMGAEVKDEENAMVIIPPENLKSIEMDLNRIPDAAMTAVVLCSIAEGTSRLSGLKNLAYKECDRLSALKNELNKMGSKIEIDEDGFTIEGQNIEQMNGAEINTYHDHRMAMCLSLMGTLVPNTIILDPSCVEKTYPNYWQDLESWIKAAQ